MSATIDRQAALSHLAQCLSFPPNITVTASLEEPGRVLDPLGLLLEVLCQKYRVLGFIIYHSPRLRHTRCRVGQGSFSLKGTDLPKNSRNNPDTSYFHKYSFILAIPSFRYSLGLV
ncbi:unnamed protein product [Rhizoctonia solani]|uniref:Uncharacterized protein n=1 Tax=Rhizoctonia solani TaxID=456999 RepID=A0A8H3GMZ1_9AGAM|nr:unnamed protein product [Rhizoctonia solani]